MSKPCMPLTKSQVYAIVREVINYKKATHDTTHVTSHVEDPKFACIFTFILAHANEIFIRKSTLDVDATIAPHIKRLNYLFNLPVSIQEEYLYCVNNERHHTTTQQQ